VVGHVVNIGSRCKQFGAGRRNRRQRQANRAEPNDE
jgi:hypothetical protein